MRDLNQEIIKFNYDQNFRDDDFYVSKSNKHIFDLLNKWPRWEKNFLNISGKKFSGKSHLVSIFLNKFKGIKFNAKLFNNDNLKQIKLHQNIVVEDLVREIDEKLFYSLFNIIDQDNKYVIVTTIDPIVNLKFELDDLNSRSKTLLLKNVSDRQISLEKKLIDYIIKKIDRSYDKIFDFIYKVDEISLKKKRPIDLKIIKEVLGE